MTIFGLLCGAVGTDEITGTARYTLGVDRAARRHRAGRPDDGPVRRRRLPRQRQPHDDQPVATPACACATCARARAEMQAVVLADAARHRRRHAVRRAARHRPDDHHLHRLRAGAQVVEDARALRQGRARRRRRAGGRVALEDAGRLHPDDVAGHPRRRGDGADPGRADHQGHPARAAADLRAPRHLLGPDRQLLDRQRAAGDPQRAADRRVGAAAAGAVPLPVPVGAVLHRGGRLQHAQQPVRRGDRRGLRRHRRDPAGARVPAVAHRAGLRARADAGAELPARDAAVARRPVGVRHAAGRRRLRRGRARCWCWCRSWRGGAAEAAWRASTASG